MCWTGRKCPAEMAALLGRSELAVRKRCARLRLCPTREGGLTSTQAAKIAGYSPQWLTHLARTGQVKARRVPGGRWWLFPVEGLPVREGAR